MAKESKGTRITRVRSFLSEIPSNDDPSILLFIRPSCSSCYDYDHYIHNFYNPDYQRVGRDTSESRQVSSGPASSLRTSHKGLNPPGISGCSLDTYGLIPNCVKGSGRYTQAIRRVCLTAPVSA